MIVAAGETFVIELGTAPATGYLWQVPVLPPGLVLQDSGVVRSPEAEIGDPVRQQFRLCGQVPGRYQLDFQLRRRWETEPVERRSFEVEVR